jgi:pimeloyl-ACP methyl ester carboxylesterase
VIVLGHGFAGSARNFGPQSRALAGRFRIVRFDARGHARSGAPEDPAAYTPAAFTEDVGRVLDQVKIERAVVGGLSMGAGVALRFALAHPERVRGLVLAAFPPGADVEGSVASVASAFADAIERDGLEAAGERFVWGPDSGLDASSAAQVRRGFLEHPPHGLAHTLRGLIALQPSVEALVDAASNLAVPALVVVGADDRMSAEPSRALAGLLPDTRLVEIPGAGHVVNLTHPIEFNGALRTFLDRLPP